MILGFVYWWPIGLAALAFLIGSGRLGSWKNGSMSRWPGGMAQMRSAGTWRQPSRSGHQAFDDYRTETLRRLEEEQREFQEFLRRLRAAKDKQEFDQFMDERRGAVVCTAGVVDQPRISSGRRPPDSNPV